MRAAEAIDEDFTDAALALARKIPVRDRAGKAAPDLPESLFPDDDECKICHKRIDIAPAESLGLTPCCFLLLCHDHLEGKMKYPWCGKKEIQEMGYKRMYDHHNMSPCANS